MDNERPYYLIVMESIEADFRRATMNMRGLSANPALSDQERKECLRLILKRTMEFEKAVQALL